MGYFICIFLGLFLGLAFSTGKNNADKDQISRLNDEIQRLRDLINTKTIPKPEKTIRLDKTSPTEKYFENSDYKKDYSSPIEYFIEEKQIEKKYLYPIKVENNHPLNGKKIVFTGDFSNMRRNEMAKMAWEVGADVDTSVSNRIGYLVKGDNYGESKLEKVAYLKEELGMNVTVISEIEFLEMF